MKHQNRLVNMSVEVSADNIGELRRCDVWRTLKTAEANGSLPEVVEFIARERPDLECDVISFLSEGMI